MFRTFGYDGDRFACYFYFQRWSYLNLGVHVSLVDRNLELHVPFGFFRLGRVDAFPFSYNAWVWNAPQKL